METFTSIISTLNGILWGMPALILLGGVGLILSIQCRFIQITKIKYILKNTLGKLGAGSSDEEKGTVSKFAAACSSIAATVGMGNIVGVASAVVLGGPGAVFWMIIAATLGSVMKYFEIILCIIYREQGEDGEYHGGPSMYISKGLNAPFLGIIITVLTAIACLCGDMIQSNVLLSNINSIFPNNISMPIQAAVLAIIIGFVVVGGVKNLGKLSSVLVPVMSIVYLLSGVIVLGCNASALPGTIALIFKGAFTTVAVGGGVAGYVMSTAIRFGIARGFFSNGGGQGIYCISHAAAKVKNPVDQAIWGVVEIILDCTICLISALTILNSGIPLAGADAATLVNKAFGQAFGFMEYVVSFTLILFTFTTVTGFCYMGESQLSTLMPAKYVKLYRVAFVLLCFVGSLTSLKVVWDCADLVGGLIMAINLPCLVILSPKVQAVTREYFGKNQKI